MKPKHLRSLVMTVIVVYFARSLTAQRSIETSALAGNWAFNLGPNTLFGLHLESAVRRPDQLQGYLMLPEDFEVNSQNGTLIQFSKISGKGEQHPVVSFGWKNGALLLKEASPRHGSDTNAIYAVTPISSTNIDVTLFPSFPKLRMERIPGEPQISPNWDSRRTYTQDDFLPDNSEMNAIVTKDQADRLTPPRSSQQALDKADRERRIQTVALLRQGLLHTGADFDHASLIFQHGTTPDDYLLAHVLAVIAISKGQRGAVWISAASLDRYLQSVNQPQVFGTQYKEFHNSPSTQEPYNRSLISDALREYMGVPDLKSQETKGRDDDSRRGIGR